MADIEYISDFLNTPGVEGKRQTRGYIPASPGNFTGAQGQNPGALHNHRRIRRDHRHGL